MLVSGFECTFPLFRTRGYNLVSPTYATRIRTYDQSSSASCFDQHSEEKPKLETDTKSNCALDGSVMLANGFSEENCNNNLLVLNWDMFEIYFVSRYFHFFMHLFIRNDAMFYTVDCEFEILCE